MKKLMVVLTCACLSVGALGCKKEKKNTEPATEPSAKTTEPTTTTPEPAPTPEPAKPATAEDRVKAYKDCFAALNAKDWEKFGACYAEDAEATFPDSGMEPVKGRAEIVAKGPKVFADAFPDMSVEPQLILVSGDKIAGVILIKGTHTQPFKGPAGEMPATNKKVGLYALHLAQFAPDKTEIAKDWHISDSGTMLGQLGVSDAPHRPAVDKGMNPEPVVVIAKDDETEKNNLAAAQKAHDAFEKRDHKAAAEFFAPDAKLIDTSSPGEMDAKKAMAFTKALLKAFPDAKGEIVDQWAAGDYVVSVSHNTGTNTGPMPLMGIKKPTGKKIDFTEVSVMKLEGGRLKEGWSFLNAMAIGIQLGLVKLPEGAAAGSEGAAKEGAAEEGAAKEGAAKEGAAAEPKADEKAGEKKADDKAEPAK